MQQKLSSNPLKFNPMKNTFIVVFLMMLFLVLSCNKNPLNASESFENEPEIRLDIKKIPLLTEKEKNEIVFISVQKNSGEQKTINAVSILFSNTSVNKILKNVTLFSADKPNSEAIQNEIGNSTEIKKATKINTEFSLNKFEEYFVLSFSAQQNANLDSTITIEAVEIEFSNQTVQKITPSKNNTIRLGHAIRSQGQDNYDTYRIPGLVTTNNGTLIAVYDARYNNSKDLQENIDIGMSRSTNGGQTWEPMKIIMDMGEWGGRPEKQNGVGDPCVLYDTQTGTLWVAALWLSGATENDAVWWASKPGIKPNETGQFVLVKSTDDGQTWSEPVNITQQIKNQKWQLLLQGPGRGITMKDGTLVFPAQFKADIGEKAIDGGQYTCHSTIVYSIDHGETWSIGTGAKSNTTEAQIVELSDGSLMLNMRDDRNRQDKSETNGRAIAVTSDLGKTWKLHSSSNSALPESNCMASIIGGNVTIDGTTKHVLFFSNPNNKYQRSNMTIKASLDEGKTWPAEFQIEINENTGYGYSCLTIIDNKTIGILYEGTKELYFQKIPVSEFFKSTEN